MKIQAKIIILNKISETFTDMLSQISKLFEDNNDVLHYVWKINKSISDMNRIIAKSLEKEIIDDEFVKTIKKFHEETDNG